MVASPSELSARQGRRTLEETVRPLLALFAQLSGMETVYLTRTDWARSEQHIQLVHDVDPAALSIPEGAVLPWEETLCRVIDERGEPWLSDVPSLYDRVPGAKQFGLRTFVSVPVAIAGTTRPVGTLCAAARSDLHPEQTLVELLTLFADMLATTMERDMALETAHARADVAEARLAGRISFAAQVEHAMRTPLATILGWAETVREHPEREDLRDQGLEIIQRTADRMAGQVSDLLDEARAAIGDGVPEDVDVRTVAEELAVTVSDRPYTVQGELPLLVDAVAFHVLLEHLVENARTHTPDGTAIRVVLDPAGVMAVEDDGPGLPDRDDLFDPFVSADPENPGTGLGLHIVLSIVERLGATLGAGASASGGARFAVTFPPGSVRPS